MYMSYAKAELAKWRKVLISWLISSDYSEDEDYKGVVIVKELPWRSERESQPFMRNWMQYMMQRSSRRLSSRLSLGFEKDYNQGDHCR